jgi:hypothetical protein
MHSLKSTTILVFAVLAICLSSLAQTPSPTPKPKVFHPKIYAFEVGAFAASDLADALTTLHNTRTAFVYRGNLKYPIMESDFPNGSSWLLGHHPDNVSFASRELPMAIGIAFVSFELQHSHHKWVRLIGHGLLLEQTGEHIYGADTNVRRFF